MSYKAQMNGGGESSGGIVPTKRQNEDQGRSKEAVEGRPLAKENMGKPNSCRTPSRESGLNGLDRVRLAAVRLTLLSEVGTVCVRSASTGLCGGCRVTGIPTATRAETCLGLFRSMEISPRPHPPDASAALWNRLLRLRF
jgi:hypothetical protein